MDSHIKKLVEKYPNDMELGQYVRQLYWLQQENYFKSPIDPMRSFPKNIKPDIEISDRVAPDKDTPKWLFKWVNLDGVVEEHKLFTNDHEWTKDQLGRNRHITEWLEVRKLKCPKKKS